MRSSIVYERARQSATTALVAGLFAATFAMPASGSEPETPGAEGEKQQDTVTVVPYKSRGTPSHRVSLHDGRVFFLKELEETESGFILHTMEEETIEVQRDEVAEVVEFKVE